MLKKTSRAFFILKCQSKVDFPVGLEVVFVTSAADRLVALIMPPDYSMMLLPYRTNGVNN
jgi:hypothetical protein